MATKLTPLCLLAALSLGAGTAAEGFELEILGGAVYGPGSMPETPLSPGRFTHIELDDMLSGVTTFFNNGPEPPNNPYEPEIFGTSTGKLSNGVPFNEHVYGGIVTIGQGALRMLAVISGDGPSEGGETYELDERLNWRLRTDMALDPGFPEGLVVSKNLDITTGVVLVKLSLQSQDGNAGGIDAAAQLPSGAPVFGRIGDEDEDGFLDGEIVGAGRVPIDYLFVPGAPMVQRRVFVSDIPVSAHASGILAIANVANLRLVLDVIDGDRPEAADYIAETLSEIGQEFSTRADRAAQRLSKIDAKEAVLAQEIADSLAKATELAGDPAAYGAAVQPVLDSLEAALPELRAAFQEAVSS